MKFLRNIILGVFLVGSFTAVNGVIQHEFDIGFDLNEVQEMDVVEESDSLAKIRGLNAKDVSSFIEKYELYFIYAHDCSACHRMIGDVRRFIDRFNLNYEAVAIGGSLPEFPDSKVDNSYVLQKIKDFEILKIPALIFVDKSSDKAISTSVGVKSEDELIAWLRTLVKSGSQVQGDSSDV